MGYSPWDCKESDMTEATSHVCKQAQKRICLRYRRRRVNLGWEDPLEKERAIQFSFLAWEVPWTKEPGGLQYMGSQRVRHD